MTERLPHAKAVLKPAVSAESFERLERTSMVSDAARLVKNMIIRGELKPGDRLPPERRLCEALRVSRATLREAIGSLVAMNILTAHQGAGTFVSSLRTEELLEPMQFAMALSHSNIEQLFEVRCVIEPAMAALAAARADAEDIHALRDCIDRTRKWRDDLGQLLYLDEELHGLVAQAAHNGIYANVQKSLEALAHTSRRITVQIPGIAEKTIEDHIRIAAAIIDRDAARARSAMATHLLRIQRQASPAVAGLDLSTRMAAPDPSPVQRETSS